MNPDNPWLRLRDAILQAPERVGLKTACVVIGLAVLFTPAQPASLRALLPEWVVLQWGGTLLVGGVATLGGIAWASRSIERLGVGLVGVGFTVYGLAVLRVAGIDGIPGGLLFLVIAAACFIRLWMSGRGRRSIESHNPPG